MKEADNVSKISFLLILFGSLEYDGRARRMVEVLSRLGKITLVDVALEGTHSSVRSIDGIKRVSILLPLGVSQVMRHLRFWLAVLRVGRDIRPDIVIAENFFTTLTGWLVAKALHAALAYDAYELIIPEPNQPMSWRNRFWYNLERWIVPRADLVIAANQERAQRMSEHYRLVRVPEFMRNIPFQQSIPVEERELLATYPALVRQSEDERIIIYQGHIALDRGIGRFVEAMAYLPAQYRLVVVGDGFDLERLKAQGQLLEQEQRFATLGAVPNQLLAAITQQADVGIVTYPYEGLNNIYCAPNKIFEYAQAGLPVVATDQPPLKFMINRYGIGELVSQYDDPVAIASVLSRVVENRASYRQRLPQFLADHRWEDEATRVQEQFRTVLSEGYLSLRR